MYDDIPDGQNCKSSPLYELPVRERPTIRHYNATAIWHLRSTTNTPCARQKSHIWETPYPHCNPTLVSHAHIYPTMTGWSYIPKPTIMQLATTSSSGRPALNSVLLSPLFSLYRLRKHVGQYPPARTGIVHVDNLIGRNYWLWKSSRRKSCFLLQAMWLLLYQMLNAFDPPCCLCFFCQTAYDCTMYVHDSLNVNSMI
jgi:hypothetical protein